MKLSANETDDPWPCRQQQHVKLLLLLLLLSQIDANFVHNSGICFFHKLFMKNSFGSSQAIEFWTRSHGAEGWRPGSLSANVRIHLNLTLCQAQRGK